MPLRIDSRLCPGDHLCPLISICPTEAISQEGFETLPRIDAALCTECGACDVCPKQAVVRLDNDIN